MHATLGMTVLWSDSVGGPQAAAVVTKVGSETLNLSIHVDHFRDHRCVSGVRYVGDPWLKTHPEHAHGVWDYTERDKAINRLLDELAPTPAKPKKAADAA